MALVIEDGTGLANATSLVTVAEWKAWATARGYTVPSDPTIEQNAIKAMDYMASREDELGGDRAYPETPQALPFPRVNVDIYGVEWEITDPVTAIPQAAKDFQYAIMKALADGIDLFPTSQDRVLKRQKTGPLEKEWFDANTSPTVPFIEAAIAPLTGFSGGFALTVRRI